MSLFKTNYSNVETNTTDYSPLPTGEYEAVIARVSEKATPNGKESLQMGLIIRNDLKQVPDLVEQNGKYADRWVFVDEWKRDINGRYIYKMENFMYYLKGAGVPEGTDIKDIEHLITLLKGKPVRVYVKLEENTYMGETKQVNRVAPWGFKPTSYPNVNHQYKDKDNKPEEDNPFSTQSEQVNISDEDMPF